MTRRQAAADVNRRLGKLLGGLVDVPPNDISPSSRLVEDLAVDSLVVAELIVALEDEFGIEFGVEAAAELPGIRTAGDLAAAVERRLTAAPASR